MIFSCLVTGTSTTQARASIKKLKANDLSILAQEPEISLGELHKIKSISKFNNNNPADPSLTNIDVEEIIDVEHLEDATHEAASNIIETELAEENE